MYSILYDTGVRNSNLNYEFGHSGRLGHLGVQEEEMGAQASLLCETPEDRF